MTALEFSAATFFSAALHHVAPFYTLEYWLVAVPVIVWVGAAGVSGHRNGRREARP